MRRSLQEPEAAGVFFSQAAYTFAELRRRGFGAAALRELQRSGLPSREVGRQKLVLGEDLIEHLKNLPPVTLPAKEKQA
jgi:hypothetical protein